MILESLSLDGVGPYATRQTLNFALTPGKPVTLLGGLNGAGKTTLVRALFHVLYGSRSLSVLDTSGSYGRFLTDSINHRREEASIELVLRIPGVRDAAALTVRRTWKRAARPTDQLDVFVAGSYDEELSESWAQTIEQIAPLGVARLFFFDGEQIEALADLEEASATLRTAIGSLLGLDLVEQLRTDLVAVQRRVLRVSDQQSSEQLEARQSELQAAQELQQQARATVLELEFELGQAEDAQRRLRDALRATGGDLLDQRDELEAAVAEAQAHEGVLRDELRDLAADPIGPLQLVPGLMRRLRDSAKSASAGAHREQLMTTLTERDRWAVDQLAVVDAAAAGALAQLLSTDRQERGSAVVAPSPFTPRTSAAALTEIVEERTSSLRGESLRLLDELDAAATATDDLDRRITQIPNVDSVRLVLGQVAEADAWQHSAAERLAQQQQLLQATTSQVARASDRRDAELKRLAESEDRVERDQRVIQHAEQAKATLAVLQVKITERHVERIASYAMECLGQLLRKERLIADLRIDPETFAVSLRNASGDLLRPSSLSAGERQLTALSLLWALARAAGRPLPVVIDTPLGRLDAEHRRHVVERYLPAASHQVLVLSTDTEINADLHERLQPVIAHEHVLQTDADGQTEILDGYLDLATA